MLQIVQNTKYVKKHNFERNVRVLDLWQQPRWLSKIVSILLFYFAVPLTLLPSTELRTGSPARGEGMIKPLSPRE